MFFIMRPLTHNLVRMAFAILVSTVYFGSQISFAQNTTLKVCGDTLHKNREAIYRNKVQNQQMVFPIFDPTYQKLKRIYSDWEECVKGQKAPFTSFKTINNESFDSASLVGKIIVVNFWFTTCAPCLVEMPALNKLVNEYREKNVVFLGFATDRVDRLKPSFFEKNRFDFQIIADSRSIANSFSVTSFPTTYIIDQKGIIQKAWIAYTDNDMDAFAPYYKAKLAIDSLLPIYKK